MNTLVIFDYSGTLSLEAVAFGRPDHLLVQLGETGLAEFGITSPDIFWNEIVYPTWMAGSTTGIGYKRIMAERIRERFGACPADTSADRIDEAVSRFVDAYLGHSRMDIRWRPVLEMLSRDPTVQILIATDHYAEATGFILNFLRDWHLPAFAIRDKHETAAQPAPILVANSADLGAPKADRRFWEQVRSSLLGNFARVAIVDDFGFNEQAGDRYGELQRVEERTANTLALLKEVFPGDVTVVPFMIGASNWEAAAGAAIGEAAERILGLLDFKPRTVNPTCKHKPDMTYPCPWVYKVIGADAGGLRQAIAAVVRERKHTVTPSRASATGKYLCFNLELQVESEVERIALYEGLKQQTTVKIVM